jgi:hypothetical protein
LLKDSWFVFSDSRVLPSLKRLPSSHEADDTPAKVPLAYLPGERFRDSGTATLRYCFGCRTL